MWRVQAATLATVIAAAVLIGGACSMKGVECAPGDFRYCDCPTRAPGYQQCLDDASKYGACDCSGTVPQGAGILVEAGAPPDATPSAAGLAGFLEPCTQNADCVTNLCFPMNAYGPHCSLPCKKDIDCPPPSPGCSNKGACKLH